MTAYKDAYDETPNQFAADSYDCVYAIKQALEAAECTPDMSAEEICDALIATFPSGDFSFTGITTGGEPATWADTGEVSKQPMGMRIENGAYVGM